MLVDCIFTKVDAEKIKAGQSIEVIESDRIWKCEQKQQLFVHKFQIIDWTPLTPPTPPYEQKQTVLRFSPLVGASSLASSAAASVSAQDKITNLIKDVNNFTKSFILKIYCFHKTDTTAFSSYLFVDSYGTSS